MSSLTHLLVAGQKPIAKTVSLNPEDPCYRYKMKQLIVQVVGKGKMIQTRFLNLEEAAKSIDSSVNPEDIVAFIGYSLSAKWDYKPNKVTYISGDISGQLEDLFKEYLDTLVICQSCGYPELEIETGDKTVKTNCKSCGTKGKPDLNEKMKRYLC